MKAKMQAHAQRKQGRLAGFAAAIALAGLTTLPALAAGPNDLGQGQPGNGQPANDTVETVLTPEQQAWYDQKVAAAAQVQAAIAQRISTKRLNPMSPCEDDPCDGDPTPPPPSVPSSKTLATRARQQYNNYYCGPASGQVVVNWSRGIVNATTSGETTANNYKKQSTLAGWMGTNSTDGTWGGSLASALNRSDAVLKPVPEWIYTYKASGTLSQFHTKVVTDIGGYSMPLVLSTKPHIDNAGPNHLESWPTEKPSARHFIVIRGYSGLYASSATIYYNDSSASYGGGTGAFVDLATVVYATNTYNNGYIVW